MDPTPSVSARPDARLVSLTAGFAYRIYRLQPAGLRIGRDGGQCDLLAPGPTVSRCHACVRAHGADTWRIEDLDSTNGVFVNDRRIDGAATLEDGDVIGLGAAGLAAATSPCPLSRPSAAVMLSCACRGACCALPTTPA